MMPSSINFISVTNERRISGIPGGSGASIARVVRPDLACVGAARRATVIEMTLLARASRFDIESGQACLLSCYDAMVDPIR
jgi:hypothetical protein